MLSARQRSLGLSTWNAPWLSILEQILILFFYEESRCYCYGIINYSLSKYQEMCSFWKMLESCEIDDAIFQDLEGLQKGGFSKWLWKSYGCFFEKFLIYYKTDIA